MKTILAALVAALMMGATAASHAKLPAPPPKSEADKAADAEKAKAGAAKEAAELDRARDRAVANYKKSHAAMDGKAAAK